ncbi:MAG: type II toxin-antitoxin system VapC family toxin [Syntrophobacteraceae bacterium]
MKICLDTSAYSYFKRGSHEAVEVIKSARWVGMPVIVIGELRTGFRLGGRLDRNERELQEFIQNHAVHILDVDQMASYHYAEAVVELRRAGTPIPTNDIWIAAIAIREGAVVITYDCHFKNIHRVGSRVLEDK